MWWLTHLTDELAKAGAHALLVAHATPRFTVTACTSFATETSPTKRASFEGETEYIWKLKQKQRQ